MKGVERGETSPSLGNGQEGELGVGSGKLKSVPKLRVFKIESHFISPEVVYYRPKSMK